MGDLVGLVAMLGMFGWIPIAVYFKHKIYLEQLQHQNRLSSDQVVQSLNELRREVQEIRDTTTKFDMSFDAALTQMEERMDALDARTPATTRVGDAAPTVRMQRR